MTWYCHELPFETEVIVHIGILNANFHNLKQVLFNKPAPTQQNEPFRKIKNTW